MRVFWQKGFAETSYGDLVEASGVSRKGLYTTFGNKEALFIASLRHYRQTVFRSILSALNKEAITLEDISTMLKELGQLAVSEAGSSGCFMANTASDDTLQISEVKYQIDAHLQSMSHSFSEALQRAGVKAKRAKVLGHYLTGVMQGLFLLAHARAREDIIEDYIAVAISTL
ncbi:MAG: TetR/AcrR family transcriptional regulator [Phormidesmis sp.]